MVLYGQDRVDAAVKARADFDALILGLVACGVTEVRVIDLAAKFPDRSPRWVRLQLEDLADTGRLPDVRPHRISWGGVYRLTPTVTTLAPSRADLRGARDDLWARIAELAQDGPAAVTYRELYALAPDRPRKWMDRELCRLITHQPLAGVRVSRARFGVYTITPIAGDQVPSLAVAA
jgi:hypothetical protein